jgi:hypothetical protein
MSDTPVAKPFSGVKLITTEYNAVTGSEIRVLESLNFGRTFPDSYCTPIVLKMNVSGVTKIKNIRLGLVKCSYDVISSGTINPDNSVTEGNFGIEKSQMLTNKTTLTSFFSGINTTDTHSDLNNILVNNLTDNSSEYVYLNLKTQDNVNRGFVGYKWFFDFIGNNSLLSAPATSSYTIENGGSLSVTATGTISVRFVSSFGDKATIIINGQSFVVKNNDGQLVWDFGGTGEHTFTTVGEKFNATAAGTTFNVIYDGTGSLLFTLTDFASSGGNSI